MLAVMMMMMMTTFNSIVSYQYRQESLANAQVSARQPWYMYIGHNSLNYPHVEPPSNISNLYIVDKYFQCATIQSPKMLVYLHSFSRCCLENTRNSAKFRDNLNLQQFKVIKGRRFWYQSKGHMPLPISH